MPDVDECQYHECRGDPEEPVDGPDGVYWFCVNHAREMVVTSDEWFEWRNPNAA